jgi:enoyl-CoA hydratase
MKAFIDRFSQVMMRVFNQPRPVVAAINGHAIAGGCVVAMAADVRLMSGGIIGLTEVAVGVPAALQRGWVDAVVPAEELLSEAIATARALGAHPRSPMPRRRTNCTCRPAPRSTRQATSTRGCVRVGCRMD